jgi:transposase-like protein
MLKRLWHTLSMAKGTGNLSGLGKQFSDETAARELLAQMRWPNGVACPRCGGADPYALKPKASGKNPARQGLYKCRACRKQFSTTTGTIFEASHIPVSKWLLALHLICASKKGMSALQLQRMLGITYRAAWFVMHRLRHAMASDGGVFGKLAGTVEVDETYIGGKQKGPFSTQRRYKNKTAVVALVERKGRVKMFPIESSHGVSSRPSHTQGPYPPSLRRRSANAPSN